MERVIEEKFVETFICKRAQSRIRSGLSDKEKRLFIRKGLSKVIDYISTDFVHLRGSKFGITDIENEVGKLEKDLNSCYVIAGENDGVIMPFKKALYECFIDDLASLIIVKDNLAFIKTENSNGISFKYILKA